MPIPVAMHVSARQIKAGDTIRWFGPNTFRSEDHDASWAGVTVERIQVPHLKAKRDTHLELVAMDGARKNYLLPVDSGAHITRAMPTYGEKLHQAADLLRHVIREHITKAQTWTPARAVGPLTQSNKGVPFVAPAELVNAAAWHIEGMLRDAQCANWWLRVARVAAHKAEAEGGTADDHLIAAAQTCVTEAMREVQSFPGGSSSEGHRLTETASWKGTAKFLEDLTNFGYRSGGLLDTYQEALANVASCGADEPALRS